MEMLADPNLLEDTIMRELYDASLKGCVSTLKTLIQRDPLILSRVSLYPFSQTPLHIASLLGHLEFCQVLLDTNPSLAGEVDSEGRCPLHLASARGHTEIVKALLLKNPEIYMSRDKHDKLPLHFAAMRGRVGAIEELMSARPDSIREMIETGDGSILHLCVLYNHLEALKIIVESMRGNHQFLSTRYKEDDTVLHLAVRRRQIKVIKYLLSLSGMSTTINTLNRAGLTPLDVLEHCPRDLITLTIEHILTEEGAQRSANTIIAQELVPLTPRLTGPQPTHPSPSSELSQPSSPQPSSSNVSQSNGSEPSQPSSSNVSQSNGSEHSQPSSPQPTSSNVSQSNGSEPSQPSSSNVSQSNGSEHSQPSSPQPTSSNVSQSNDSEPSQPSSSNVSQSNGSEHSQPSSPQPTSSNVSQSNDSEPSQPSSSNVSQSNGSEHSQPSSPQPTSSNVSQSNGSEPSQPSSSNVSQSNGSEHSQPSSPQPTSSNVSQSNDSEPSQPSSSNVSQSNGSEHSQPSSPQPTSSNVSQSNGSEPFQPSSPQPSSSNVPIPPANPSQSNGSEPSQSSSPQPSSSAWKRFENFCTNQDNWVEQRTREQWMVAATVMATMTFQSALSPPGGVWQADTHDGSFTCNQYDYCEAGTAVVGYVWSSDFLKFIFFNSTSFFASLCVVLVLISGFPLKNTVIMYILAILMLVAITCMLLTYMWALGLVSPNHIYNGTRDLGYILVGIWSFLLFVVGLIQTTRVVFWFRSRGRRSSTTNASVTQNSSGG